MGKCTLPPAWPGGATSRDRMNLTDAIKT